MEKIGHNVSVVAMKHATIMFTVLQLYNTCTCRESMVSSMSVSCTSSEPSVAIGIYIGDV